jgi:hypothetical protein
LLLTDKNQPNSHIHTLKRYKEKLYPCLVATGLPNFTAGEECTNQVIKKNIMHSPIYYSPLPAHGQISGIVRSHEQDLHIVSNQRLLSANSESIKHCTKRFLEDRLSAQAFLVTTAESVCVSVDQLIDLVDDGWFEGLVLKRKAN